MPNKLYFANITADHWASKNKLQEEAKEYSGEINGTLVSEQKFPAFLEEIYTHLKDLNKKHKRCKPLYISIQSMEKEYSIYVDNVFHLHFFTVKHQIR